MSSVPSPADAPAVDVRLPEGAVVRGRLYARRQTADGWLYQVGLVLWRAVDTEHSGPGEYRSWVPGSAVERVAGADYTAVPTERLPTDIPLPPVATVQPAPASRWLVVPDRYAYDSTVRRTAVHRADCWQATQQGGGIELESREEARAAMALPTARGCIQCGTDQDLR